MIKLLASLITLFTLITLNKASLIPGLIIRQANTTATGGGGFAIRGVSCSTNQVDCGGGVTQEICCPIGTFCFNGDDEVCCPTDDDCTNQTFLAPKCADPSAYLCTDYIPDTPTFAPNNPGYWCCPVGTQCFVSEQGGYVCRSAESGDVAASTVASGQAPTQASTATTLPTLPATVGKTVSGSAGTGGGVTTAATQSATTKAAQGTDQTSNPAGTGGSTAPTKSSAIRISGPLHYGPVFFIGHVAFAFGVTVLQVL